MSDGPWPWRNSSLSLASIWILALAEVDAIHRGGPNHPRGRGEVGKKSRDKKDGQEGGSRYVHSICNVVDVGCETRRRMISTLSSFVSLARAVGSHCVWWFEWFVAKFAKNPGRSPPRLFDVLSSLVWYGRSRPFYLFRASFLPSAPSQKKKKHSVPYFVFWFCLARAVFVALFFPNLNSRGKYSLGEKTYCCPSLSTIIVRVHSPRLAAWTHLDAERNRVAETKNDGDVPNVVQNNRVGCSVERGRIVRKSEKSPQPRKIEQGPNY